jgi:hypothetical protein
MQAKASVMKPGGSRGVKYAYIATLFLLTLTGFAQMPIFKRYYIADIPGLGWLDQFYTTHFLHYLAAVAILGLAAYLATEHLFSHRKNRSLTASGIARALLLFGILITGVLLVVKNSFTAPFSPATVIFLNLAHLGLVMIFLFYALYCLIAGKTWTRPEV